MNTPPHPHSPGWSWKSARPAASLKTLTACAFRLGPHRAERRCLEWQVAATFTVSSSGRTPIDHLDVPAGGVPVRSDAARLRMSKPDDANAKPLHVALGGGSHGPVPILGERAGSPSELRPPASPGSSLYGLPRLFRSPMP